MGRTHAAAFAASGRARIHAIYDRNPDALTSVRGANSIDTGSAAAAAALADARQMTSVEAMFADPEVQLVSITTPTDSHVELALAAIAAGKHVLVEKPVSLDPAAIRSIGDAAAAKGVLAMPAHCMRFWPSWVWMREAIKSAKLGTPLRARFQRMGQAPSWSKDFYLDDARSGGAAIDLHIHDADFVRAAFGEPTSVHASGSRRHIVSAYGFAGGLRVTAEGAWVDDPNFAFVMTAVIECERGTLDFRLGRKRELLFRQNGTEVEVPVAAGTGYDGEVRALLDAIACGASEAPVTMEEAAKTQELLQRELLAIP
ncbi:MAG: Gfo/Idh/MocA family oxidoreductase [Phycisphaerales bacterium]|nr:Gfo/Idh/MocA family oxidoreductase [Phycisphaerales bacterium]